MDAEPRRIGDIANYYGGLRVKEDAGMYFWSIENWDGDDWDEIPEWLYRALVRYEDDRESKGGD